MPDAFMPLSDYATPPLPTEEAFRRVLGRVLALLKRGESKPFIADDRLTRTAVETLDEVVAPPACGPLLDEIDATVAEWREAVAAGRRERRLVLVLPPCDGNHVVETWARLRGHAVLAPPPRADLLGPAGAQPPSLAGEGLLVVPRLERWFLRHRNGLALARRLVAAVEAAPRPVIVGCNSWAWAFLSRTIGLDAMLPEPMTFRAFDAERLHRWFAELAEDEATRGFSFRLPQTGEDVLARDDRGELASTFLGKLAGCSLGIPWVAWHLWRRSLRSQHDPSVAEEAGEIASGGERASERTLWIAALDEYVLPGAHERTALWVLHALLLHGGLTVDELGRVLPTVGESNVMPVLLKSGFVERAEATFRVRAAAYPSVVDGLRKAGFPADGMPE